ncbi:MAG: hypothetical protein AB3N18_06950 [Allomuricauda sp.]
MSKIKIQIASDVCERDGIGMEIYLDNKLVIEIFRDDTREKREISVYDNDVSLELMEFAISEFKKEIPWDFIDYSKLDADG